MQRLIKRNDWTMIGWPCDVRVITDQRVATRMRSDLEGLMKDDDERQQR